jgi:hypothetical protein
MHDWQPLLQTGACLASGGLTAFNLGRLGRAIAWNLYLKVLGVGVVQRRELALQVARLDLKTAPQPEPSPAPNALIPLPAAASDPQVEANAEPRSVTIASGWRRGRGQA